MANPWIDWILYSNPHSTPNRNPNPPNNVHTTGHPNPHSTLNPSTYYTKCRIGKSHMKTGFSQL